MSAAASDDDRTAQAPLQTPGWIAIGRHGRPALSREVRLTAAEYRDWWRRYDEGGLAADQSPPPALRQLAAEADLLLSSTLPRAIETAQAIAEGRSIQHDAIFIEAPLPPPRVPGRRTPGEWGVWARCAWWLGASDGQETRQEAEARAVEAAHRLIASARAGRNVLLCAHGWFNRMMRPVLLQAGWSCAIDGGDTYWSFRRYELQDLRAAHGQGGRSALQHSP